MAPRRGGRNDLRRRVGIRRQRERILVICEGKVTETEYLKGVRSHFRSLSVEVLDCTFIGAGCGPLGVVKGAVRRRDDADRQAKSRHDPYRRYDSVWAIVDVDEHADLLQAVQLARRESIRLLVSNPCFELWMLLHYQDYRIDAHRSQVQAKLLGHLPGYDKHVPTDFPYPAHATARTRAQTIDPDHATHNRIGRSPSTNVWLVVDAIKAVGRP